MSRGAQTCPGSCPRPLRSARRPAGAGILLECFPRQRRDWHPNHPAITLTNVSGIGKDASALPDHARPRAPHLRPLPDEGNCCTPGIQRRRVARSSGTLLTPHSSHRSQVRVPGGTFLMGDAFAEGYPRDGEGPVHEVELSTFHLDTTAVTNAAFASFVDATGYVTDAERFGSSAVFHLLVDAAADVVGTVPGAPWWAEVRGACWRRPGGGRSGIGHLHDHPVVQVSWNDAQAYCSWAGKRLPTEAEWEYAARGTLAGQRFVWGNELTPGGVWQCNIWQGRFPLANSEEDGFLGTAPVNSFSPNGYGLWCMAGNVWEWCADWFDPSYYVTSPKVDPQGPGTGVSRVMRGGSYLCHDSYCNRYRVAARSANTPDSSSGNLGFRCANNDSLNGSA
ncbi:formylglycine-generating enzyme family protein [Micromonospora sp. NPDC047074]|uniref:formylglycine-generating enzyme family protein n=1 Tax=Micromonospora sp. NPDC047074 TaxID=3154339 RepID=UPI0033D75F5F